jgi:hypothetical protein
VAATLSSGSLIYAMNGGYDIYARAPTHTHTHNTYVYDIVRYIGNLINFTRLS